MDTWYIVLLSATTVIIVALGAIELWLHRKRLARIPIRVHVNGTRGKSSVTRLIAAGLRAGGVTTCAKTTGTLPRMIMPDGREYPVFRPARANIIEQLRIVSAANAYKAQALVIECMALQPYLQWLSEARIVRATHGVITNARPDHLDVMGPTERDVALALAGMTPHGQTLYTAERDHLDVFQMSAADRGSKCVGITLEEVQAISAEDLAGFRYIEHAENVALALKICASVGVDRATALRGMWEATPDPGAMMTYDVDFFGRRITFVNAFAANDPESTERVWDIAIERFPDVDRRIAVFNCRADRPDRSIQLGEAYPKWQQADELVLMGSGTYIFAKAGVPSGLDSSRVHHVDDYSTDQIFETLIGLSGRSALIVGMGNIGGQGLDLVAYFRNRSILSPSAPSQRASQDASDASSKDAAA